MPTEKNHNTERPPIIAIMGHIDHGKSTLLSYIRKSSVPLREAGGITQHISAYEVEHESADGVRRSITFIDTPGHEAFSGIRERGARVADIAVLVVSAEDGVKQQTLEAYKSIMESKTPFIVAINKIDKPEADIPRTKQSLAEHGIYIEGYGGDIPAVALSAKTGEGVSDLLDMILLVAEIEHLTGDHDTHGEGIIIESDCDKHKGIRATCIIKNGTVRAGSFVVSGKSMAPVRIMENYLGKHLDTATFSSPVAIIGWDNLPTVGSTFRSYENREQARAAVAEYASQESESAHASAVTALPEGMVALPIIVKADTQGSLEAVLHELGKLSTDRVQIQVIMTGIGSISENDVRRALGNHMAVVIGFNTKTDGPAKSFAERNGIDIQTFTIIYKMSEWVAEQVLARTPKTNAEESMGLAKIVKIFSKVKDRQIVGGKVERGAITLGSQVKIIRREAVIGEGKIKELQEQKNRTSEVSEGKEFGAMVEAKTEIAPGDRIESITIVQK